eukprot:3509342-Pyramimonas_sp.AAC.1
MKGAGHHRTTCGATCCILRRRILHNPHLVLRATQQGRYVRIVWRKLRHLPTGIQPGLPTCLPPYFNSKVNYDTLHEHQNEDLPHINICGKVAVRQNQRRRFYLREQPVGTRVDQIPPWTTLANSKGIFKVSMAQCTTGLRDSHGVLMRKPTEVMANHRLLLAPF